ncbi:MAG: cytochrome b/b6 domain-containing protein [Chloroflexi bacterium]|nr:cytochrome b/b6 domain-containing protein [Chloroflexota bacterium]
MPKPASFRLTAAPLVKTAANGERSYMRFSLAHRIEHWLFMLSFTTLGVTGLIQKYAANPVSIGIVQFLGGIENSRAIHHFAATVMMLVTIYHIGIVAYRLYVRRVRFTMLPGLADVQNAIFSLLYNLGLSTRAPQQGRYTFEEKLEYWAVVWGTVVMAVTGFMMWNPIATTKFFSGQFIPAAKAAHGGEAVLAVLSILLWHMYHVIVRSFNKSMFTGYVTEKDLLHEHPLELADIKAGIAYPPTDQIIRDKRTRIFLPSYAVLTVVLLAGVFFFIRYEETALATIPPVETVQVFAPLTPTPLPTHVPTRTPLPDGLADWDNGFGPLLNQRCGICHNASAKIGRVDLTTYATALLPGASGPAIVPGKPDESQVIIVQSQGNHAEQLSADEIAQLRQWIQDGAVEK